MYNEELLFSLWKEIYGSGGYNPTDAQKEAERVYEAMRKKLDSLY